MTPERKRIRRPWGMSLVEIMIAVTMVTILASAATMTYRSFLPGARADRADHDLKTMAEALSTHDRDHPDNIYQEFGLEGLVGQYIDHTPDDPWGAAYVVDPFFGRIVCTGPDNQLQTPIPGYDILPLDETGYDDDIIRFYARPGWLTFIEGDELIKLSPDGVDFEIVDRGVGGSDRADPAPGAARFAQSKSGTLYILEHSPFGGTLPRDARFQDENGDFVGITADDVRFSGRGDSIAFTVESRKAIGMVSLTPTTGVVTRPIYPVENEDGGTAFSDLQDLESPRLPFFTAGNRSLVFLDSGKGEIYRVSATEHSPITTVTADSVSSEEDDDDTVSGLAFAMSPNGKLAVYVDDGGQLVARSVNSGKKFVILPEAPSGTVGVAVGPRSKRVALTDGASIFVTPLEEDVPTFHGDIFPQVVYAGSGIRYLAWK